MWELVVKDAMGNEVVYWCKSIGAALTRARDYCHAVGGVQEIQIRPSTKGGGDDRRAA